MAGHHQRGALVMRHLRQQLRGLRGGRVIQAGRGLVGQDHLWLQQHRPRQRDALCLATR